MKYISIIYKRHHIKHQQAIDTLDHTSIRRIVIDCRKTKFEFPFHILDKIFYTLSRISTEKKRECHRI